VYELPEEQTDEEIEAAYRRFAQRLKKRVAECHPSKDQALRARVERLDAEAPHQARFFAEAQERLQRLKAEFQITLQPPSNLHDLLTFLLARRRAASDHPSTLAAAELYSLLHGTPGFSGVSPKEFRKALIRMEKERLIDLQESQGTLIVRLRHEFLSDDEVALLDLAARKGGSLSLEQAMLSTGWPRARVRAAMDALLSKKMAVREKSFVRGTRYRL